MDAEQQGHVWERQQLAVVDELDHLGAEEHARDAANNAKWVALGQPDMVIPT